MHYFFQDTAENGRHKGASQGNQISFMRENAKCDCLVGTEPVFGDKDIGFMAKKKHCLQHGTETTASLILCFTPNHEEREGGGQLMYG